MFCSSTAPLPPCTGHRDERELPSPVSGKAQALVVSRAVLGPKTSVEFLNRNYVFKRDSLPSCLLYLCPVLSGYTLPMDIISYIKKLFLQELPGFQLWEEVKHSKPCKSM